VGHALDEVGFGRWVVGQQPDPAATHDRAGVLWSWEAEAPRLLVPALLLPLEAWGVPRALERLLV